MDLLITPFATSQQTLTAGPAWDWSSLPLEGLAGGTEGAAGEAYSWGTRCSFLQAALEVWERAPAWGTGHLVCRRARPSPALSKSPPLLDSEYALGQDGP